MSNNCNPQPGSATYLKPWLLSVTQQLGWLVGGIMDNDSYYGYGSVSKPMESPVVHIKIAEWFMDVNNPLKMVFS